MFPNNPLFVEKLVQTKQEEITREMQDATTYEFRDDRESPIELKLKVKQKMWALIGLLIVLGWLFG